MKKMIVLLVTYLFAQGMMIAQERTIVKENLKFKDLTIGELSKSIENSDEAIYFLTIESKLTSKNIMTLGKIDDAIRDVDNFLKKTQSLEPSNDLKNFEVTIGDKNYNAAVTKVFEEIIIVLYPEGETGQDKLIITNYAGWKVFLDELEKEKKKSKKK